jgi:predicted nucleic acid-binding Zn ribbon protein
VKANEMLVEAVVHTENISSVDRKRKLSDSNETETLVVENREVAGDVIECITSVDEVVNEKERGEKKEKKARKDNILFFLICLLLRLIFVFCIDKVLLMFLLPSFISSCMSKTNESSLVVENREVAGDVIECITSVDEVVNEKERGETKEKKARKDNINEIFLFFLICLLLRLIFVFCIDKVPLMFLLPSFISSCMSKTNESSISISSPVVVSPSTALFPILPFFITFKGDFSFITISCGSGDFSISPPVVIMLSPLEVPSSSSELSKEISFILSFRASE